MTQSSDEPLSRPAFTGADLFGPGPRQEWMARVGAETSRRCRIRRERVLAHPDLAAALCRPPLGFAQPQMWTGFVPPRTGPEELPEPVKPMTRNRKRGKDGEDPEPRLWRATGPTDANESPRRKALVAICAEAMRRDMEAGTAQPEPDLFTLLPMPPEHRQAAPAAGPAATPHVQPPAPQQAAEPLPGGQWPEGTIGAQSNPPPARRRPRREPA
jgi:hypothetical protein